MFRIQPSGTKGLASRKPGRQRHLSGSFLFFVFRHQVIARRFLHGVFARFRIEREHLLAGATVHATGRRVDVEQATVFAIDEDPTRRAIEVGADIVLKATKVDGVYSSDPNKDPTAEKFDHLTYDRVIENKLGVMDANAIVLCRDQSMPIRVFNVFDEGNLVRIAQGEAIATLVS